MYIFDLNLWILRDEQNFLRIKKADYLFFLRLAALRSSWYMIFNKKTRVSVWCIRPSLLLLSSSELLKFLFSRWTHLLYTSPNALTHACLHSNTHIQTPKCAVASGANPQQLKPGRVRVFSFLRHTATFYFLQWQCASPQRRAPLISMPSALPL